MLSTNNLYILEFGYTLVGTAKILLVIAKKPKIQWGDVEDIAPTKAYFYYFNLYSQKIRNELIGSASFPLYCGFRKTILID